MKTRRGALSVLFGVSLGVSQVLAAESSRSVEELTAALSQGSAEEPLAAAAQERHDRMARLVGINPAEALRLALPGDARALLSPRVRGFVEEWVELEGEIEIMVEDREDGSRRLTFLRTDSGERYALSFASQPTLFSTGTRVKVSGVRIDSSIAVASGAADVERVTAGVSTESVEATTILGQTFGAQRTVVILVNFSNNPTQPYSVASAQSVVAATSNFDLENSYGQTWLSADVFGWYTIAQTSTAPCDYMTLASQAKAAATAAGVNLSGYTRQLFAFPNNTCGWWGLGTVGGWPSMAWVNGSLALQVVGHEMGHNLGLDHAHSLDCGTVVLGTTCTTNEYGDSMDIMGSSVYHFSAFHKEKLGWLDYGASPPMTTVAASGTFSIEPMETNGSASKALKIPRGTGSYFYVELKRGLGFDAGLVSNANVTNGVIVHMTTPADTYSASLLDMTATTASWSDPALVAGQSYTDPTSGVAITVNSVSATAASVTVTLGGTPPPPPPPACAHVAPSVGLVTAQTSGVKAGTAVSYTFSVMNKDVSPCASSTFNLTSSLPSGWTASLTPSSLTLVAGATGSTTLKVTSPGSAANGSYTVGATAKNSGDAATASASTSYVVNNSASGSSGTFTDAFARADATGLGSAWTAIAGNLVVAANMVKNGGGATGNSSAVVAALSGATETVEADFTSVNNNLGPRFGVFLRWQDSKNYYLIYRQTGGSSRLLISRFVNGTETILGTSSLANPTKNVAFHLTGRITGTTLSLDFNGVNKINATDASFATGKVGILIGNGTATVQQQADNFKATVQ